MDDALRLPLGDGELVEIVEVDLCTSCTTGALYARIRVSFAANLFPSGCFVGFLLPRRARWARLPR
jgi:hypothetical protein